MGFGKDGMGAILYDQVNTNYGALAALGVAEIQGGYHDALVDDFRIIKTQYQIGIRAAAGVVLQDGPLIFGMADASLTSTEIKECIDSRVLNQGQVPEEEESMRPVWPLEIFNVLDPDAGNGGMSPGPITGSFNPRWTFRNPEGFTYWIFNLGNVVTITGSFIQGLFKHFGVWVK